LCALCAELDRASRDTIIACHSPKLDSAFFELLSARCGSMVLRELLGACACKVSHHEPRLQSPIHAALLQRVADARNNQDDRNVRICALHICGIMALQAGKSLASSLNDTLEACARQLKYGFSCGSCFFVIFVEPILYALSNFSANLTNSSLVSLQSNAFAERSVAPESCALSKSGAIFSNSSSKQSLTMMFVLSLIINRFLDVFSFLFFFSFFQIAVCGKNCRC
jgi:hypothetical protein